MQVQRIDNMLNFAYEKTSKEVIDKAVDKVSSIRSKIEERQARIDKIRTEYKITDLVFNNILRQMREQEKRGTVLANYSTQSSGQDDDGHEPAEAVTIGAGIINLLLTEGDFIEGEKAQVEKLTTIINNLRDMVKFTSTGAPYSVGHSLSLPELKFLGF